MSLSHSPSRRHSVAAAVSEALENRRLYTTTFYKTDGILYVENYGDSAQITVTTMAGNIFIRENGVQVGSLSSSKTKGLVLTAGGGNDNIDVSYLTTTNNVPIPTTIFGGDGNDTILGNSVDDVIYGEAGDDFIYDTGGNDFISGGDGDDTIRTAGGADTFSGGEGNDTIDCTRATSAILVTLDGLANDYTDGNRFVGIDHLYDDFENVIGSKFNDAIYGNAAANSLYGMLGKDTIYGGDGDDSISGGGGRDVLYGEAGNDTIYNDEGDGIAPEADTVHGGDGDDVFLGFYDSAIDAIYGGAGYDTVTDHDSNDLVYDIEELF